MTRPFCCFWVHCEHGPDCPRKLSVSIRKRIEAQTGKKLEVTTERPECYRERKP